MQMTQQKDKTTEKFSAEDLEVNWSGKIGGQLVREKKTVHLYKLEHVNSKHPCCMSMLKPQIDQSL